MYKNRIALTRPRGVTFHDLKVRWFNNSLYFEWSVLVRVFVASGLSEEVLRKESVEGIFNLLYEWYLAHLHAGGSMVPAMHELLDHLVDIPKTQECSLRLVMDGEPPAIKQGGGTSAGENAVH